MLTQVVIAVRGGPAAKGRCAPVLGASARAELTTAMLGDMLAVLGEASTVSRIWAVTPTPELADSAARAGATPILETAAEGLAAAFTTALQRIGRESPDTLVMLVPGDLPHLDARELDAVIAAHRPGEITLVAARADGGTGAVLMGASTPLAFSYGPGSLERHRLAALALGLQVRVVAVPGLAFDLDRPTDIAAVLASPRATRTRALLQSLQPATEAAA